MAKSSGMVGNMDGWRSVWEAADHRRTQLGWSLSDLYENTGVSETTFRKMRTEGAPIVRESKIARMCIGLGWTTDSVDRILTGERPLWTSEGVPVISAIELVNQLRAEVEALAALVRDQGQQIGQLTGVVMELRGRRVAGGSST
jgi:DNA-binding Xre family transcriptional regulator